MKINKNLDLEGNEDDRSSQKSNLASSSQPKNEFHKTQGAPNGDNKNSELLMDLKKIQQSIGQDNKDENSAQKEKEKDTDLADQLRETKSQD